MPRPVFRVLIIWRKSSLAPIIENVGKKVKIWFPDFTWAMEGFLPATFSLLLPFLFQLRISRFSKNTHFPVIFPRTKAFPLSCQPARFYRPPPPPHPGSNRGLPSSPFLPHFLSSPFENRASLGRHLSISLSPLLFLFVLFLSHKLLNP